MTSTSPTTTWTALGPDLATGLGDARLQLHYAAQFATAMGISYLKPRPDDSHTNLGWNTKLEALASREVRALSHSVRVAIRPRDLTLLVLVDSAIGQRIPLNGSTISQVEHTLRSALAATGLDSRRLTLHRHYELPLHAIAGGHPFDTSRLDDFTELAHWYGNGALVLGALRARLGGSEVRCWPHHFDIATLTTLGPGRSSGAGMLPGDEMFPEPYFYVNVHPVPEPDRLGAFRLEGGGTWNTDGWTGGVLTSSRLEPDPSAQEAQVRAFFDSAVDACTRLLTN